MTDCAENTAGYATGSTLDGRYLLRNEIGCGAMGTVWEALDQQTSVVVAVKVVHPRFLGSASARKRFFREVESATALLHPHTVRVLAHGQTPSGGGYLVMERLYGGTFGSRLRELGALPQWRAIKIAAQILDAAGAAHRLQIVHRDLKPGNVVLLHQDDDPDFVKVCDFGLAKAIDVDGGEAIGMRQDAREPPSRPTSIGEICGTPEYMAPEQARGEAIDGRADLYAVGVMLFEAVTGMLPFSGRTPLAVISRHLSAPPPRLREVRPDLQIFPPLEGLLLRALAKDRAERPSSADVFRADLLQIGRDLARWQQRRKSRGAAASDVETLPGRSLGGRVHARSARHWLAFGAASLVAVSTIVFVVGLRGGAILKGRVTPADSPAVTVAQSREARQPEPAAVERPSVIPQQSSPAGQQPSPAAVSARAMTTRFPTRVPLNRLSVARARGTSGLAIEAHARAPVPSAPKEVPLEPVPTSDPRADNRASLESAEDLLSQGRIAEACDLGQSAATTAPHSAPAWEFLGRCRMRLGQPGQAREAYRRYLELVPDGPSTVFIRAMLERRGG